jgi:hypothetical protein
MGDTLISMGLCGPVDIFRAIREQGRDRVADLFMWRGGTVSFYRGHIAPHVEFPLDLDLPNLMLAGLEAAKPGDAPMEDHRADFDRKLAATKPADDLFSIDALAWPPSIARVQALVKEPIALRELLRGAARAGNLAPGDVLRAVTILLAAGLVAWKS